MLHIFDSGEMPPEDKSQTDGEYPFMVRTGIIGYCGKFNLSEMRSVIGRVGTSGAVNRVTAGVISEYALMYTRSRRRLTWDL